MDIDLLSKMVKELILDNDRVVLPGLGSFVAEIVPSSFSDKGYTINPPYRRLYFRSKPDQGDALAEFYASSNQIDSAVAAKIIGDFVSELKSVLHSKKTVVFPGLGRLRATKENNVFFIADEDLDIYPAGFGLEPISLKTHQETQAEVSAAVEGLKSLLVEPVPQQEVVRLPEDAEQREEIPQVEMKEVGAVADSSPEQVSEAVPQQTEESLHDDEPAETDELRSTISETDGKTSGRKIFVVILCVVLVVAAVLLIALAVVGRLCPDFVDRFLYTPEELEILNQTLK